MPVLPDTREGRWVESVVAASKADGTHLMLKTHGFSHWDLCDLHCWSEAQGRREIEVVLLQWSVRLRSIIVNAYAVHSRLQQSGLRHAAWSWPDCSTQKVKTEMAICTSCTSAHTNET